MKIAIKDRQRSNSAAKLKREKAVSERRRANKAESLRLYSDKAVCVEPPQTCDTYFIQGRTRPLYIVNVCWRGRSAEDDT